MSMPSLLFLVTDQANRVIYHCHSITELFRLRSSFDVPADAKLFRYVNTVKYDDAYFRWDKDTTQWVYGGPIGFGLCKFDDLKAANEILMRMKKK